ncbi:MAG TPA: alpha/beta fold hydrolase [Acidimicrobiales bacterium]|nr:alpha/beta fold hydrolase [Acidimicrobiales bacterium]
MTSPIIPGAEPFSHQGGLNGVLVLHGFTGNPQSLRPLAEALATVGYTVELPLLPGHGTVIDDMVPTRFTDWATAARRAYDDLATRCRQVAVAALSMGGTLACQLAEADPDIKALVLVNPMADPPAESFRDVLRGLLSSGIEIAPGVGSDIARPGVTELAYSGSPVAAALSLFEGVDEVAASLGRIQCPVLLFSSRNDHVVPSSSGDLLAARVSGPVERVWLERSYHVATLDYDAGEIEARMVSFLDGVFAGQRLPASSSTSLGPAGR